MMVMIAHSLQEKLNPNKFIQPTGNNALSILVPAFVARRLMTALGFLRCNEERKDGNRTLRLSLWLQSSGR